MKRIMIGLFVMAMVAGCSSSNEVSSATSSSSSQSLSSELTSSEQEILEAQEALYLEQEKSFAFFWETTTNNPESAGFGLSRDRWPGNSSIASIASVGFALAAIPSGVERGYITFNEGYSRALDTLVSLSQMTRVEGFYYHFVNMVTGAREWNSEVSIIDTGLMLAGAIVAAQYFGDEVATLVDEIYLGVNWDWYVNPDTLMFYMGYKPETGHGGAWDHFAEQIILYVLAAGHPTYTYGDRLYKRLKFLSSNFTRGYTSTSTSEVVEPFIYTYDGSLFQHQFSHAFIDFRDVLDYQNTDWFINAKRATRANYLFTLDNANRYKTYSDVSWGISAGDGPNEYRAYGAQPAKNNSHNGTIVPYAAVASINYWEYESLMATRHYSTIEELQTTYGFADAYNLGPLDPSYNPTIDALTPWFDSDVIGIDKGITLLMIENYRSNLIWDMFMSNSRVIEGLTNLGFSFR
ncbi:MAG TPA: hypothetical protein DCX17_02790 [Firmicutes bacterium]|jgi:hypothetical protein|nr:hypothetical protein [Bacillota bacterium]